MLPDLDYQVVNTIFNLPAKLDFADHFRGANVNGLLVPGVDGDFAELVVFDEDQWSALQESIFEECRNKGFEF